MQVSRRDGDIDAGLPLTARVADKLASLVPIGSAQLASPVPLVSFTFDDAPVSACLAGAEILATFGARATYYIAGDLIGAEAPFWRMADLELLASVHRAGHEIACHTASHSPVPSLSAEAIRREAARNADLLKAIDPHLMLENFAFPYGIASVGAKRTLKGLYRTSRGIRTGLNAGRVDRHLLRANPLVDVHTDIDGIRRLMDEALERKAWLIFYGHDVTAKPSPYGCRPELLEAALRAAAARDIRCVTVSRALQWLS